MCPFLVVTDLHYGYEDSLLRIKPLDAAKAAVLAGSDPSGFVRRFIDTFISEYLLCRVTLVHCVAKNVHSLTCCNLAKT